MGKNPFYKVEKLVAMKVDPKSGERQFKARWVGYSAKDDSWVAEGDLNSDAHTFPLSPAVAKVMGTDAVSTPRKSRRKATTPVPLSGMRSTNASQSKTPGRMSGSGKGKKAVAQSTPESTNKQKAAATKRAMEANSGDVRRSGRTKTPTKSASEVIDTGSRTPKKHAREETSNLTKTPRKRRKSSAEKKNSHDTRLEDEYWAVERILGLRGAGQSREVKLRWKGFSWRFDTWVKEADLLQPIHEFPMSAGLKQKINE